MFGIWISFLDYQVVKVTILLYTCIDNFIKFVRFIPCFKGEGALSTPECANLFFSNIVRLFGIPKMVLYNRDLRFTSNFWKALWEFLDTKVFFTSAYHL